MHWQSSTINKNPLRDSVVHKLENSIINLELKPGDRLKETEISEILGVSRGPIREAFRELEGSGLIEFIPYKGAVVSNLSENDIEELRMCRMIVEKLAANLLIKNSKTEEEILNDFDSIIFDMTKAKDEKDLSRFLALDFKFHNVLVIHANNNLLREMWKPISSRLRRYFYLNSRQGYVSLDESLKQHIDIIEAIKQGDLEKTNELLQKHKCWS